MCGTGRNIPLFEKYIPKSISAIDVSQEAIEVLRAKFPEVKAY